jgi:hypothetical protein
VVGPQHPQPVGRHRFDLGDRVGRGAMPSITGWPVGERVVRAWV